MYTETLYKALPAFTCMQAFRFDWKFAHACHLTNRTVHRKEGARVTPHHIKFEKYSNSTDV